MNTPARILIMDDEHSLLMLMASLLERTGYEVDVAADGPEAIALYRERLDAQAPHDLVILDIHVCGEVVGPSVFEALQQMDPEVTAIAASGSLSENLPEDVCTNRFAAFLPKPFKVDELLELVRSLVTRRSSGHP